MKILVELDIRCPKLLDEVNGVAKEKWVSCGLTAKICGLVEGAGIGVVVGISVDEKDKVE